MTTHAAPATKGSIDAAPAQPDPADLAWMTALGGRFVVFDGPDGTGKTTQFNRFLERCRGAGLTVCDVREPGGTAIGEKIRDILLDKSAGAMSPTCEMLLYMASRAQLVEERIRPALERGELVLADRFVSSTLAYQGAGGGVAKADIEAVAKAAFHELRPDLVVIFDADEATAAKRVSADRDRIESRDASYRQRVRDGYLDQARRDPEGCVVIDAAPPAEEVAQELLKTIRARLA